MTKNKSEDKGNQIGKIVTLKSHYLRGSHSLLDKLIYIAGDDNSIPPFMIVTEYLKESKSKHDEETGEGIIERGTYRCNVIWFNSKTYEFKDTWINSKFFNETFIKEEKATDLKDKEKKKDSKILIGSRVILKTTPLEIKKKRTLLTKNKKSTDLKNTTLASFCAPEMIVIGKTFFKPKKPINDNITGLPIRFYPSMMLKCKYYNPISDKFSEVTLPKQCFELAFSDNEKLEKVIELMENEKVVFHENKLLVIKNISYLHGVYMLFCQNFVDETEVTHNLDDIDVTYEFNQEELKGEVLAPKWNGSSFYSVLKLAKETKGNKKLNHQLYHITYRNLKSQTTNRFIHIKNYQKIEVTKNNKKVTKGLLVKAFCFLRNKERTFTFTDDRLFDIRKVDENLKLIDIEPIKKLKDLLKEKT